MRSTTLKRHSVTGSAGRFAALASLVPAAPGLAALVFLAATLPVAPRAIAAEGGRAAVRQPFAYADTDSATAQVGSGRVRFLEGNLKIQRADAETVDEGTVNAPVFPGDTLSTASSARAEVQLSNGAIVRLDQNTKVAFIALPVSTEAGEDVVLQLPEGTAQIELRRAPPRDVDYRVDTPSASVYLLSSGSFRLDVEGRYGKVRVSSYRGIAEVVGDESSVMLRSGQRTMVSQSGEPDSPRAFNTVASDGFDGWVLDRNANYLQGRPADAGGGVDEAEIPDPIQPYRSELSTYGSWVTIEPYGNCWIPVGRLPRLAPVLERLLVEHAVRLLLGLLRSLGLGPVPLWPLGLGAGVRLGLVPRLDLLRRLGQLVLRTRLRGLGAARLLGLALLDGVRLSVDRLPLLELRRLPRRVRAAPAQGLCSDQRGPGGARPPDRRDSPQAGADLAARHLEQQDLARPRA